MKPVNLDVSERLRAPRTYISLCFGLAVVGYGGGHLRGGAGVHFILQLCDLLGQLLQSLHDVGSLLGFHSSVLLQAVDQSLEDQDAADKET